MKTVAQRYITIDGFEQLSKQQLFDMALSHIRSTRRQAKHVAGGCTYAGTGCAASPFLRPQERTTAYAGWMDLLRQALVPSHEPSLVCRIQSAHDNYFGDAAGFMPHFEKEMSEVAWMFDLTYTPEKVA